MVDDVLVSVSTWWALHIQKDKDKLNIGDKQNG
jgi:hypothetical protein